jgi:hypothetical protein
MDNTKNLDDYLAGLGISEPGEVVLPAAPHSGPAAANAPGEPGEGGAELQPPPGTLSPQETLERFLTGLLSRVDSELTLTLRQGEGALEAEIQGAQAARLAGRDGRVLGAIEVLAYAALSRRATTKCGCGSTRAVSADATPRIWAKWPRGWRYRWPRPESLTRCSPCRPRTAGSSTSRCKATRWCRPSPSVRGLRGG